MSERAPDSASGAAALGLLCSAPAALPACARVLGSGQGASAVVALIGAVSVVVVPVGYWWRRSREAGFPSSDRALASGVALSSLPLALFGGVLKSTTHHRPLGGATFAVVALGFLALCIGLSFRVLLTESHAAVKSAWQNLFTLGCGLSLAGAALLGLGRAVRPSLVDFLALGVACAAAGFVKMPARLARSKLPVVLAGWAVLLLGAVLSLRQPELVRSLATQAPVSFAALSWLGDGS